MVSQLHATADKYVSNIFKVVSQNDHVIKLPDKKAMSSLTKAKEYVIDKEKKPEKIVTRISKVSPCIDVQKSENTIIVPDTNRMS